MSPGVLVLVCKKKEWVIEGGGGQRKVHNSCANQIEP